MSCKSRFILTHDAFVKRQNIMVGFSDSVGSAVSLINTGIYMFYDYTGNIVLKSKNNSTSSHLSQTIVYTFSPNIWYDVEVIWESGIGTMLYINGIKIGGNLPDNITQSDLSLLRMTPSFQYYTTSLGSTNVSCGVDYIRAYSLIE